MANSRKLSKVAGGAIASLAVVVAWGTEVDARAAKSSSGVPAVLTVNVRGRTNVPANEIIEILFSTAVDAASVTPATVFVRAQNATQSGYTKQIPGSFNVSGNVVKFFPRLPGHRRDETGAFYPQGSANDDATLNAGLQPAKNYQITILGRPAATTVRTTRGRPLARTSTAKFTTAAASDPEILFTSRTYSDAPPPQFSFSNPPDTVPTPDTQYATRGGTKGVPSDLSVQLYCTRVPVSPVTARAPGNISMTMVERYGNPALRRPSQGSVFVEQNSETTLLVFKPRFPLADQGQYSLRVSKNVKDLTEQSDFLNNRDRERLRQVYEFMSTERSNNPGVPAEELSDPPQSLVGDWPPPTDTEARGILKRNILILGDGSPDEIDPRVMVMFSSRDEPVTTAQWILEFRRSENLFDAQLSTGDWDTSSALDVAQGVFTFAAGSVVDGDFLPKTSQTLTASAATGYTFNYRNVVVPQGVVITIGGARPATIKCLSFQLDGIIAADGNPGADAPQSPGQTSASYTQNLGGKGGPGGGDGGNSASTTWDVGGDGKPGVDSNGVQLPPGEGGLGGQGGQFTRTGVNYTTNGGGGGGGGARLKGEDGAKSTNQPSNWTGNAGGLGGAGSANDDLDPFGGGAGGGAGGSGAWISSTWGTNGGGGGGGGGALTVQTSGTLTISATGLIRAVGGKGGRGACGQYNYYESGPGAGGGGGSLMLRSTRGFNLANAPAAIDVSGGARGVAGTGGPVYGAPYGGAGGAGYAMFQDPSGGADTAASVPGSKSGVFDPVGAGVPSYVYSKWFDLGNEDPLILPFNEKDPEEPRTRSLKDNLATNPTSNDAIYVEIQMTREDTSNFGSPNVSRIDGSQNSTDLAVTSQWNSMKVHDNTTLPGSGAFPIPGYDKATQGSEYAGFPVGALNGKGYRFVRYRIYFQCDQTQDYDDPLPNVDFIVLRYQYNL